MTTSASDFLSSSLCESQVSWSRPSVRCRRPKLLDGKKRWPRMPLTRSTKFQVPASAITSSPPRSLAETIRCRRDERAIQARGPSVGWRLE